MSRNQKIILCLLLAGHIVILVSGVFYWHVDWDEGGTLVVSREVINGRIPVLDINAHNQPLLYYFYGAWMKAFSGNSIPGARALNALCIFSTGVILLWWAWRFTRNHWVAVSLYALYISNITFFKANITAKPFALSNLLTFSSFAVLSAACVSKRRLKPFPEVFLSGLLLGASMGVRLIFTLPLAFAAWISLAAILDKAGLKETLKRLVVFSSGVALPIIPSVLIFIKEPLLSYTVWAGAYAQIYLGKGSNPDFSTNVLGDIRGELAVNGLIAALKAPDTALLLLLVALSTLIFLIKIKKEAVRERRNVFLLVWMVSASILWVCSNLFVSYPAYANQLVLYSIILTVPLMERISGYLTPRRFGALCAFFSIALALPLYYNFATKHRGGSPFSMLDGRASGEARALTPSFVNEVAGEISRFSKNGDTVFDSLAMFVFASGRRPLKGFEYPTDMVIYWNFMEHKENAAKYRYIPMDELFKRFERKEFPVVLIGDDTELARRVEDKRILRTWGPNEALRKEIEKHYVLYRRYYAKPSNIWILMYLPGGPARAQMAGSPA